MEELPFVVHKILFWTSRKANILGFRPLCFHGCFDGCYCVLYLCLPLIRQLKHVFPLRVRLGASLMMILERKRQGRQLWKSNQDGTPAKSDSQFQTHFVFKAPQWGAVDEEIKVPSDENTEFKRSPFKAWIRSACSHTCYTYCQGLLPCLCLPFRSFHLHFFQNVSRFFLVLAVANTGSCVGPQNKIGHPVGCRFPCWVPTKYTLAPLSMPRSSVE